MKMKKWLLSAIALCLALCTVLSGCAPAASGDQDTTETTEGTVDIMQKEDPTQDDTFNLLMIGNSFCYYYTDELYGMAKAAGIKLRVCNVYYSGCTLEEHWTWWKNGNAFYEFFTIDENGSKKLEGCSLEYCLQQQNWDAISLQEAGRCVQNKSAELMLATTETYRTDLLNYLREQFPQSRLLWHQTWAFQVGYDRGGGYTVPDAEEQKGYAQRMKEAVVEICKQANLERVNSGEAWQIVRDGGYDNLCARMSINNGEGDYYHDGDIGGGQYLNACVWFEVLTGQSCIGNTFRPSYELSEDMITMLQQAAHEAVASR